MNTPIWSIQIGSTKFRIVQVNLADCIVEASDPPVADPDATPHWQPVDDDALAAQIYMTAYLQLRGTLSQVQDLVNNR